MTNNKAIRILKDEIERVGNLPVMSYYDYYRMKLHKLRSGVENWDNKHYVIESFTCGDVKLSDLLDVLTTGVTGNECLSLVLQYDTKLISKEFIKTLQFHKFDYNHIDLDPIEIENSKNEYNKYREENKEEVEKYERALKDKHSSFLNSVSKLYMESFLNRI